MVILHYGSWDSWGFEISYCPPERTFSISFIHWWVAIEVTKK